MSAPVDWEAARRKPFADVETPEDWPEGVKPMSWQGTNLLGADGKGGLYWDGKKIKTEIKLGWAAKLLGVLIAFFTFLAAVATVTMAITDVLRFLDGK
ncbi:hypothetical protein [Sinorhizobium medicae]|uniref:hypothetical protein n=1 Tax=Sinorhizobium medicae TaxID=110321 RepID=UPI001296A142|nr:hypothetical protein [Sinorhizobium medicae]MDX0530758.1 hypothetical protein [Sinorhizobium medicae]MDX0948962.1 hypothetical protein [Sinorhizobium medicae]MQV48298.1 hypothetical protein [Sinorhizobium medicae]MQV53910.1 hypothetical protein [Sinorhizobium medicae]MQV71555.1 hypothetical protein [Sinorhizobium medicae]